MSWGFLRRMRNGSNNKCLEGIHFRLNQRKSVTLGKEARNALET